MSFVVIVIVVVVVVVVVVVDVSINTLSYSKGRVHDRVDREPVNNTHT